MADEIINCKTLKDPALLAPNDVIKHLVYYTLDDGSGNVTGVEITVEASEMTDPNDSNEVKTLADAKAATYKTAWMSSTLSAPTITDSNAINGPVTL